MSVVQFISRLALVSVLSALLAGCLSGGRPEESETIRSVVPTEAIDLWTPPRFEPGWGSHSAADEGRAHNILALSSGGADGAYGAGILVGWSESGTRPEFDVVSGVSTGALMAVMAFLGPQYDDDLEAYYAEISNDEIYRNRGVLGVLSDSLLDNGPLKEQIEKAVTRELLDKIAAEHERGRRLYIATTNLDSGQLIVWDMGKIADGGRADDVQFFQKILRASAAVPAFFPPVYVKPIRGFQLRQAHVDGAVKAPVLIGDFMLPPGGREKNLYVVVNGYTTRLNDDEAVKPSVIGIAQKAVTELVRELTDDTLYRGYILTRNANAKFWLTSVPDDIEKAQSLQFDEERNRKLFDTGRTNGRAGLSDWKRQPPRLSHLEMIAAN